MATYLNDFKLLVETKMKFIMERKSLITRTVRVTRATKV